MTREEQIIKQGIFYTSQICPACISGDDPFNGDVRDLNRNKAFEAGAKWADEHPDLSSLWHGPSEEPQGDEWEVLCDADDCYLTTDPWTLAWKVGQSWEKYVRVNCIKRWLYLSDLFPKGGEK